MNPYLRFILRFIKEIQTIPTKVETFVFATRLHRITHLLARLPFPRAIEELGHTVRDWSGGTRIGECLQQFTSFRGGGALGSSTVVMYIPTDGIAGTRCCWNKKWPKFHRRSYGSSGWTLSWAGGLTSPPVGDEGCFTSRGFVPFRSQPRQTGTVGRHHWRHTVGFSEIAPLS